MTSIEQNNKDAFDLLVAQATCDVNLLNGEAKTALEIALLDMRNLTMAEKLVSVDRRANLDLVDPVKGETLFHKAIRRNDFSAIQFLVKHGANMNKPNSNVRFNLSGYCYYYIIFCIINVRLNFEVSNIFIK